MRNIKMLLNILIMILFVYCITLTFTSCSSVEEKSEISAQSQLTPTVSVADTTPALNTTKQFTTENWDEIFTISNIEEYSYSKVIGNNYEWAKGNIINNSINDFSEIRISIDVDFGDGKRNFSDTVYNLKGGKTIPFTVTLTQSEQKSITRNQIPICKVVEVKYYINEYKVQLDKSKASSESVSTSNTYTTTPTYSNSEIKRWMEARYDYYDKKEGRNCGDKYTKTIYQEAASKFNLTLDEIDKIW